MEGTMDTAEKDTIKPKRKPRAKTKKKGVDNTMDQFQDGRPTNSDSNDSFSSQLGMNHDVNAYSHNPADQNMMADPYGSGRMVPVDGINSMMIHGYQPYNRTMNDQHSMHMSNNNEYNHSYSGHMQLSAMRPNFPLGHKGNINMLRPGMSHIMNQNPTQRITTPAQNMSPPSGPTPTLNQLLQAPNTNPRFPNNYQDYSPTHKSSEMMTGQYPMQSGWGGVNRPTMSYGQSSAAMPMNGPYRNQVGGEMNAAVRRVGYPSSASPYPPQQFSPNSQQRYPNRPSSASSAGRTYLQDIANTNPIQDRQRCTSTPTTSSPHMVGTPLRPVPSPVGSTGSRSNTPASIPGQVNSPRLSESESSQTNLSPITTQSPSPNSPHLTAASQMHHHMSSLPPHGLSQPRMPPSPSSNSSIYGYTGSMPPPNQMYSKTPMGSNPPYSLSQYPSLGQVNSPRPSDSSRTTLSPIPRQSPSPNQPHPTGASQMHHGSALPPHAASQQRMAPSPSSNSSNYGYTGSMPPPNQMYGKATMGPCPPYNLPQYPSQGNINGPKGGLSNGPVYNQPHQNYMPFNSYSGHQNQTLTDQSSQFSQYNGPLSGQTSQPVNSTTSLSFTSSSNAIISKTQSSQPGNTVTLSNCNSQNSPSLQSNLSTDSSSQHSLPELVNDANAIRTEGRLDKRDDGESVGPPNTTVTLPSSTTMATSTGISEACSKNAQDAAQQVLVAAAASSSVRSTIRPPVNVQRISPSFSSISPGPVNTGYPAPNHQNGSQNAPTVISACSDSGSGAPGNSSSPFYRNSAQYNSHGAMYGSHPQLNGFIDQRIPNSQDTSMDGAMHSRPTSNSSSTDSNGVVLNNNISQNSIPNASFDKSEYAGNKTINYPSVVGQRSNNCQQYPSFSHVTSSVTTNSVSMTKTSLAHPTTVPQPHPAVPQSHRGDITNNSTYQDQRTDQSNSFLNQYPAQNRAYPYGDSTANSRQPFMRDWITTNAAPPNQYNERMAMYPGNNQPYVNQAPPPQQNPPNAPHTGSTGIPAAAYSARSSYPNTAAMNASYQGNYLPPHYHNPQTMLKPGHSELSALTDATNRIGAAEQHVRQPTSTLHDSSKMTPYMVSEGSVIPAASSSSSTPVTMVTQSIMSPVTSITENSNSSSNDTMLQQETFVCGSAPVVHHAPVDEKRIVKKDCNINYGPMTCGLPLDGNSERMPSPQWPPNVFKSVNDISKLYEMGNEHDRRFFLDKLVQYLDEQCTPITMMPSISKQPLDIYKLYHIVRERGGMVEVTRQKKWKEICSQVNISASASAAFTLKKNYIKYLFAYECQYDRGGMNPAPVLAQMEAQLRQKRDSKNRRDAATSNAQENYSRSSSGPSNMDMYSSNVGMQHHFMPPEQMPPNMMSMMGNQGQGSYNQSNMSMQPGTIPQPGRDNISITDPFSDEAQAPNYRYSSTQPVPPMANQQYGAPNQSHTVGHPGAEGGRFISPDQYPDRYAHSQTTNAAPDPGRSSVDQLRPPAPPFSTSDRIDQGNQTHLAANSYRPLPPTDPSFSTPYENSSMNKPVVEASTNLAQFPSASQRTLIRSDYSTPIKKYPEADRRDGYNMSPSGYVSQTPPYPHPSYTRSTMSQDQHENRREASWTPVQQCVRGYPPSSTATLPFVNQASRHRRPFVCMTSPQTLDKAYSPCKNRSPKPVTMDQPLPPKRELQFPVGSVEASQPVMVKRRKMTAKDIGPVDPWRVMLALKSGLLAECTWAFNCLSILLSDESAMNYFGLVHLPGLLDTLLDHYRRLLIEIFGKFDDMELQSVKRDRHPDCDTSLRKDDPLNDSNLTIDTSFDASETKDLSPPTEAAKEVSSNGDASRVDKPGEVCLGDYNAITRQGKLVKIEEESKREYDDEASPPCKDTCFTSGLDHWAYGNADSTDHIICHFESKTSRCVTRRSFFNYRSDDCHACLDSLERCDNWRGCCHGTDEAGVTGITIGSTNGANQMFDREDTVRGSTKSENSVPCPTSPLNSTVDIKLEPPESDRSNSPLPADDIKREQCPSDLTCSSSTDQTVLAKHESDSAGELTKPDSAEIHEPNSAGGCEQSIDIKREDGDVGLGYLKCQKRMLEEDLEEEESYEHDNPSLLLSSTVHLELYTRCVTVSNVIRNLSFLPGNDVEMAKHPGLLNVISRLLLLHHEHLPHLRRKRQFDKNDESDDVVDLTHGQSEWWWILVQDLRENSLVCLANMAARLNLSKFPEPICVRLLEGILHWSVCPSASARDPLATSNSVITAQSLVLETMCKLSVHKVNIDLLVATAPFSRIIQLIAILVRILANRKPQVYQEFAIVLLAAMVNSDSGISRIAALQHPCISLLIDFLECAEQTAMQIVNAHGVSSLCDNAADVMGTSIDMLRRVASTLVELSRHTHNHVLFIRQQHRILSLVMSQILDYQVIQSLSDVLFECTRTLR